MPPLLSAKRNQQGGRRAPEREISGISFQLSELDIYEKRT